jgi:hypothetical protein
MIPIKQIRWPHFFQQEKVKMAMHDPLKMAKGIPA